MDAIERAIRKALEKGDAHDEAFRERVYKSAFSALERALRQKENIPADLTESRRQRLRDKIVEIETEFMPAEETPSPEPMPEPPPRMEPEPNRRVEPAFEQQAAVRSPRAAEPVIDPSERPASFRSETDRRDDDDAIELGRSRRPRRKFAVMFLIVVLLAAIGMGVWWTIQSGILLPIEARDSSVPNPPTELESENFRPESLPDDVTGGSVADSDWITIFDPSDSTEVTVPNQVDAEIVELDSQAYLRVRSIGGSEVLFDIGQGTLERLSGGKALFSISAIAEEGNPTQISVACDLAELGNCGRKRYEVGSTPGEFLFEIDLPARQPDAAGTLAINPDISGTGLPVYIREIRVAAVR